jgi:hypothetical protein
LRTGARTGFPTGGPGVERHHRGTSAGGGVAGGARRPTAPIVLAPRVDAGNLHDGINDAGQIGHGLSIHVMVVARTGAPGRVGQTRRTGVGGTGRKSGALVGGQFQNVVTAVVPNGCPHPHDDNSRIPGLLGGGFGLHLIGGCTVGDDQHQLCRIGPSIGRKQCFRHVNASMGVGGAAGEWQVERVGDDLVVARKTKRRVHGRGTEF